VERNGMEGEGDEFHCHDNRRRLLCVPRKLAGISLAF
jgi:hypothetical protein